MKVPRLRSLRARSAATAGAAVLVGSLLVTVVALILVQGALTRSLDDALSASASDVIAQLAENPPSSGDPVQLPPVDPRNPVIVQIIDPGGAAVATTPGVNPAARICPAGATTGAQTVDLDQPGLTGTFRILATTTTTDGAEHLVCTARSDEGAESTHFAMLVALLLVTAVITVLVVLLVARGVGSALGAVADLTSEAERLRKLDQGRLSVPDTQDEVAELAVTLNSMLDRLHVQDTVTRQFVADAGHELRTPLTSLRLELELAVGNRDAGSASAAAALTDVDRLAVLVDDLIALARSDAGEALHPRPVDLPTELAVEVHNAARLRDGVDVTVRGGPVGALAEPAALRRAVRNLLSNGVRHADSRVELLVSAAGPHAVIEVVDDGIGVPAEETSRIFERFTRLDAARARDSGGSGLGLAIVAAFAERSGGDVTARPGPGGRFVLRLPRADRPTHLDTA